MSAPPRFTGGPDIAMKVPPHQWEETVSFYRDVLRLQQLEDTGKGAARSVAFAFGANTLWIDRVTGLSQAEIWLEVVTDDTDAAAEHLHDEEVVRRDEIEPLPEKLDAFWIANPASIIHLVVKGES